MKILKIRTFNLNSLKGEKQIDFTEDRFVQTGFFAITGSTGAGKTTLLDAITLALYGEIPRQSDPKQIMSYGTAEAWAEVEFEVQDKKYRAKWSLARARRKPDGELQGVKRELADITESSEGQILGEKIKEVQEKIVEITGLDFQRFLRSVMLAQGEFAAFLKADKKERGVLLERVTDTSIYTELSRKAHEIEKEKRHALDLERKNIKEEDLLTPEGRNSLENQLEQEKIRLEQIKKELEKISFQKNWLEKVQNLARQCEQAQNTWEQAQTAFEKFAPERKRLERHEQLTILKPDYLLLTNFEKALSEQTQKINLLEAELPTLKNRLDQSKKRMEDSEKELEKVQTEKAEQEPVFAKVLALDSRLKDLYENLQKLNLEYKEQEKILTENLQKLQEKEGLEKAEEESIQKIQDWLVKKANFEQIGAELGTLQIWDEERKDFAKNVSNKTLKISELEKDKTNLDKQIEGQKTDLEKMEAWKKAQQEKIRVLETEIAEKLEGKTVQAWQEKNEFSAQTISHLEKMQGLAERFLKNKNKLQILENQIVEKTKSKENSLLDLAKTEKELAEAQEQSKLLEKLWEAEKQIAKYEADRKTLEKDQACPLCGSVHHPFVGAYKVDLSLAERQFQEQKSKVKTLETAFQKSQTQIQITENELVSLEKQKTEQAEEQEKIGREFGEWRVKLTSDGKPSDFGVSLTSTTVEKSGLITSDGKPSDFGASLTLASDVNLENTAFFEEKLALERSVWEKNRKKLAEVLEKQRAVEQEKKAWEDRNLKATDLEKSLEKNKNACEKTVSDMARLEQEKTELLKNQAITEKKLAEKISLWGESLANEAWLENLKKNAENYQSVLKTLEEKKKNLAKIQSEKAGLEAQILEQSKQIESKKVEGSSQKQLFLEEQKQRKALFGEKNVETERKKLQEQESFCKKQLADNQALVKTEQEKFLLAESEQRTLQDNLARTAQEKTEKEKHFLEKIAEIGLVNRADFEATFLDEARERLLKNEAKNLEKAYWETKSLAESKAKEYETEKANPLTVKDLAGLESEKQNWEEAEKESNQKMATAKAYLENDSRLQGKFAEIQEKIEKQTKEWQRWANLDKLIGSASGEVFRTFAQSLTLRKLAEKANQHLENLNPRYQIEAKEDLELDIIDLYQANHVRSMKTLSGGESFLVSLALALGLSDLASRKANIGSLFIDEGFGTLDSQTLDVVIATLEALQAQGKMIGIISHVETLKERISTQIQVRKLAGGVSELKIV